jgi:hypothetical protein
VCTIADRDSEYGDVISKPRIIVNVQTSPSVSKNFLEIGRERNFLNWIIRHVEECPSNADTFTILNDGSNDILDSNPEEVGIFGSGLKRGSPVPIKQSHTIYKSLRRAFYLCIPFILLRGLRVRV